MIFVEDRIKVSPKGYVCESYDLSKEHDRLSQQVFIKTYPLTARGCCIRHRFPKSRNINFLVMKHLQSYVAKHINKKHL